MKSLKHYPLLGVAIGLLALWLPQTLFAKTVRQNPTIGSKSNPQYLQKLEELEQKQKTLERHFELEEEKKKEKEKGQALIGASSEGFYLKSQDGNNQLKIRGYVQADARFLFDNNPKKAAHTFVLRRVRPIFEGTVAKYFDFRVMPDFGEGKVVLQDAYFDTKIRPEFKIRVGKFKEPVGLERLQSATNLTFVERGLPTNLVPNRDLGIELFGDIGGGLITYEIGVFNGVADGGSTDTDSNKEKDFAGRIFSQPFKKTSIAVLQGFGVGISGSLGKQTGSETAPNLGTYKSPGQQTFFSYRNDGTPEGTTYADGTRYRISPQGYYYYGPFGLLGEYVLSSQRVKKGEDSTDLLNSSWQVETSYVLAGGKASYKGVNPKKPIGAHGFGAVELTARYGELEIDKDAFPTFADPNKASRKAQAWGVGVNWYLNKNAKVVLSYDQTHFKGGSPDGNNRATEKALFNRYQIIF